MWIRLGALDRIPPQRRDALLAAGLALVLLAVHWPWPVADGAAAYHLQNSATIMAGCALLVWRRRYPVLVWCILAPAFVLGVALHVATGPLFVLGWLALYGVPAHATPRRAVVVGWCVLPIAVGVITYMTTTGPGAQAQGGLPAAVMLSMAYVGSAWLLGRYRRTRKAYLAALHERAARLEREREAVARQAAAEERAWIARELHDLLAHTMSGIVVLAGGAHRAAEVRPETAVRALGEIERTGRAGMAETRLLLDALQVAGDRASAALPSLRELPALADRMRATGLDVELSIEGHADTVPRPCDLAAYRIAQEALTNTLRHARARGRPHRAPLPARRRGGDHHRHRAGRHGGGGPGARDCRDAGTSPAARRRVAGRARAGRRLGGTRPAAARPARRRGHDVMTTRVLICDDAPIVRAGLRLLIDTEPDLEVVGEAGNGEEAVMAVTRLLPDVVLLDIQMPGVNGVVATGRILAAHTGTRVLILTTFDRDEYIHETLRAGARGFLLKDAPPEQVLGAIRLVAAGEAALAPSVTRRLLETMAPVLPRRADNSPLADLSTQDIQLLRLIARGWTNDEIATELNLTLGMVKTYVSRLFARIGARDRTHAAVLAYDNGLVRPGG